MERKLGPKKVETVTKEASSMNPSGMPQTMAANNKLLNQVGGLVCFVAVSNSYERERTQL